MGLFFKDNLSDVGKYGGSYGKQKSYGVKSGQDNKMIQIHCEKTGPYKLFDDEFRQVLEKVKRDPGLIKQYNLASTGGLPIIENKTGRTIYVYFSKKSGIFSGNQIYAKPTHARKVNT